MQLQHNPSFTNTFPICHGISWPQEAAFHNSDSREFSESLEKKYHSPKTFTFYSCLPHVCLHIVLLSCTVSWLGLKFDKLFAFAWGHLSTMAPIYWAIHKVVLGSHAVPSDLEMEVCTEGLTWNIRVGKGVNLRQDKDLAEGQKFQSRTQFSFWLPQQMLLGEWKANRVLVNISSSEINSVLL